MKTAEEIIQEAKLVIEEGKKEVDKRQVIKEISSVLLNELKPVLDNIASQFKDSVTQYLEGIKNIHIEVPQVTVNTPDVKVPEANVKVEIPKIEIPAINLPDIHIPEIKIPDIKIDTLKFEQAIAKAFKGLKYPEPKVTVQERDFPKEMAVKGIGGYFKSLLEAFKGLLRVQIEGIDTKSPLAVILTDLKGNPYRAEMSVMSGGSRGGAVLIEGHSGLSEGTVTVSTAGTRVQLSSISLPCRRVFIQAHEDNLDMIVIGSVGVVAAKVGRKGLTLAPTQGEFLNVNDLNLIYVDAVNSGDKVNYYYEV